MPVCVSLLIGLVRHTANLLGESVQETYILTAGLQFIGRNENVIGIAARIFL
jgi:hypothetical protein